MGRETRRVPLDFDWPLNVTWSGYLRPDSLDAVPCPDCRDTGLTPARQWVEQISRLLLMLDEDLGAQERGRPMHPYLNSTGSRARGGRPSADIAEFGRGLAGRDRPPFGHGAADGWRATEKVITAAGLDPETWGVCATCAGKGSTEAYPGQEAEAEAWKPTDPPAGDGWQMWETTSEGSPMSPVFETAEALASWLADTKASLFGSVGADAATWLRIITGAAS